MFDLTHSHTVFMAQNVVKVLKGSLHTQRNNTYTIIVRSSSLDSAVWSKSGCGSRRSEIVVESGRVGHGGVHLGILCVSQGKRLDFEQISFGCFTLV